MPAGAGAAPSTAAISLDRVSRRFVTPTGPYTAIADLSLDIAAGSFVALVGPSGCGKSTVLNLIAGLASPNAGQVRINGRPLAGLNRHAGYMLQQDGLLPWKSVLANVTLGLELRGVARAARDADGRAWLDRIGLARVADYFPAQLSGGMRKRVALAQQWIVNPDLLLLDEPFSALDVHTRVRMEDELLQLWAGTGKTVVFVTHDLDEALALADQVVVLSAGPASRVVSSHRVPLGRPRDLLNIRTDPQFVDLYRTIWVDLRAEVVRSFEPRRA